MLVLGDKFDNPNFVKVKNQTTEHKKQDQERHRQKATDGNVFRGMPKLSDLCWTGN